MCPLLFCNQSEHHCQNKKFPQNSIHSGPLSISYISGTPFNFGAPTYVPCFSNRYCMYIRSTSSLLVSSTPEKHYNFFRVYKDRLIWTWKTHFQFYQALSSSSLYQLQQFPSGLAYCRKTLPSFFGFTKDCLIWTWKAHILSILSGVIVK